MKELTPLENELSQLSLSRSLIINSSKKLIYNKLRNSNNATTDHANLRKGTKCVKLLLLKAPKVMYEPLFQCFSLHLPTHE